MMATKKTTKKRTQNRPAPETGTDAMQRFGSVPFLFNSPRGATPKISKSGKFLGFYSSDERKEQKAGIASRTTPLGNELKERERSYRAHIGKLRFKYGKDQANKKSQQVRGKTAAKVLELAAVMRDVDIPEHEIAGRIARKIGKTPQRVRQILREENKRKFTGEGN